MIIHRLLKTLTVILFLYFHEIILVILFFFENFPLKKFIEILDDFIKFLHLSVYLMVG